MNTETFGAQRYCGSGVRVDHPDVEVSVALPHCLQVRLTLA
jgi:hypothetical protein